ncbi:methyltransferase family protein [Rhodococcus wratislaviensis]|uniref:3-demethylubiquinone-9 3-methyltransferase n=2 Tax=Rhodococcus TaxID=1827 RepID=A0AB38FHC0_RHOWR|nr:MULTISPECIES: class I SAM-dependent methyltransferase [Rhodococcus]AII05864.1 SAM-dependent methlyltransferase [Rhodococcus opacus]REE73232.1 methyltransferase family protein [Rhodococcus wratislaviensis]WAM17042.1 class I SAM-dependent methyltransferase [Rhodococcus sp. JS3073]SPZ41083.1 3-demethylubiquinone-9 3-methyltransferase [Rhodococcus wratislaviensis]
MDAAAWDERYSQSELVWGAPPNAVVVERVTSLPRGRALDLACGEGRNAHWLATRGWEVTGLDYSAVALDKARRVAAEAPRSVRERLDYRVADVTDSDLGGEYDLVLMIYLHLAPEERLQVVNRAISALKPDGILMILGHDAVNLSQGVGGPQDPEILYTPDDLVNSFDGRLAVDVAERRFRETDAGTAIDALVVAHRSSLGSQVNGA